MRRRNKPKKEFTELLLEVRRVTRVTTGGRRMSFRATVLIGNKKGKVGVGVAKGPDVSIAVRKASHEAYKNIFIVPLTKASTVPYPLTVKYKSCVVKLLPASAGTGLKAWSSVRSVLEFAGYENILSKIVGSNNKLNNALATIKALTLYKHKEHFVGLHEKGGTDTQEEDAQTTTEQHTTKKRTKSPVKKDTADIKKQITSSTKKDDKKITTKKSATKEEK